MTDTKKRTRSANRPKIVILQEKAEQAAKRVEYHQRLLKEAQQEHREAEKELRLLEEQERATAAERLEALREEQKRLEALLNQ